MGNHSAVRPRPPDLRQVLARGLAVLLVVAAAVVLGLLLTDRDVPPPQVTAPAPGSSTAPVAEPLTIADDERAAVLGVAATATEQVVEQVADPNELMTPRYARIYRRTLRHDDSVTTATVVGTGLVGIDREQADVLVLLDGVDGVDRADAGPENLLLHLRRDRGSWRVDDLAPLTTPVDHVEEPDRARSDLLTTAAGAVEGQVLAAGIASYDTTQASVLAVTEDHRLRVAMTLVDGTWRAEVSDLEPVSAD